MASKSPNADLEKKIGEKQYKSDQKDLKEKYGKQTDDLREITNRTNTYIDELRARNAGIFNSANAGTGALATNLQGNLQEGSDARAAQAMAELQRLGVSEVGLGSYGRDADLAAMLAAQAQSNNVLNMGNRKAMSDINYGNLDASNIAQGAMTRQLAKADYDEKFGDRQREWKDLQTALKLKAAAERKANEAAARRYSSGGYGGGGYGFSRYGGGAGGGMVRLAGQNAGQSAGQKAYELAVARKANKDRAKNGNKGGYWQTPGASKGTPWNSTIR